MSANDAALQALLDEADCARLCTAFVTHIDQCDYAPLLALFTDDGVLDRMGTVMAGRDAIARFLDARPADLVTRHLSTDFSLRFESADAAIGRSVVLFCQGRRQPRAPGEPADAAATMTAPPAVVEYHDRYRRTAAGWRIGERRIRMALHGLPLPPQEV
jgi:ketosteroid isomerase-like protein